MTSDCLGKGIYSQLVSKNLSFNFVVDPTSVPGSAAAGYDPNTTNISIKNINELQVVNLREELIHSIQDKTLSGGTYQYRPGHVGSANIEFESKLLRDINDFNTTGGGYALPANPEYMLWLDDITNGGTIYPTSFSQIQQPAGNITNPYFHFMDLWITNEQNNPTSPYRTNIVNPSMTPITMFNVLNQSPCAH